MNYCVVPARKGSQRFVDKNISLLNDKPLICHTIEHAIESKIFDQIIVSSDDERIEKIVKYRYKENKNVFFDYRPDYLCSNTSKAIEVVRYYIEKIYDRETILAQDTIFLLLPTAPLRKSEDLVEIFKILKSDKIDSVVSVTTCEFPPQLSLKMSKDGFICSWDEINCPFENDLTRSQDWEELYRPDGKVYASKLESIIKLGNFFKGNVKGYKISRERFSDIDHAVDLKYTEFLLSNKND